MTEDAVDFGWFDVLRARDEDMTSIHLIDTTSLVSNVSSDFFKLYSLSTNNRLFVAKRHKTGAVIGYILVSFTDYYREDLPGHSYISRFAVESKFRRCGVGSALLTTVMVETRNVPGCYGLVADVRKSNDVSLKFFTRKHCFGVNSKLSREFWYAQGNTPEERHKIVVYKTFARPRVDTV